MNPDDKPTGDPKVTWDEFASLIEWDDHLCDKLGAAGTSVYLATFDRYPGQTYRVDPDGACYLVHFDPAGQEVIDTVLPDGIPNDCITSSPTRVRHPPYLVELTPG